MTDDPRRGSAMPPVLGALILVLSGLGFPLTQLAIARFGRRGAVLAEGVSAGLLVRDVALVRLGAPRRLRPVPAALLWCELGAAAVASVAGLSAIAAPGRPLSRTPVAALEVVRRASVGVLFGLHTYRFWIYLQPGRGLRATSEVRDDVSVEVV